MSKRRSSDAGGTISDAKRQAAARNCIRIGTDTYAELVPAVVQAGGVYGSFVASTERLVATWERLVLQIACLRWIPPQNVVVVLPLEIDRLFFGLFFAKDTGCSRAQILSADNQCVELKEAVFRRDQSKVVDWCLRHAIATKNYSLSSSCISVVMTVVSVFLDEIALFSISLEPCSPNPSG